MQNIGPARWPALTAGAIACLIAVAPAIAAAAVLTVPGQFPEVRDAVEAASAGDTIQVGSGTYNDRVRVEELDGLTIEGSDTGGGAPVMDVGSDDDAFRVRESTNVSISGFVIVSGQRGVRVGKDSADVIVTDVTIDGCEEGFRVRGGTGHILMGNTVLGTTSGRGVRVEKSVDVHLDSNLINATAREGIRAKSASGVRITNNVITGAARHGIRVDKCDDAVVGDATLGGNVSSQNGRSGIRVKKSNALSVSSNVTEENTGYGIRIQKSPPLSAVSDLIAAGNTAQCNGLGDFRVDGDVDPGACGGGSSTTTTTSTTVSTTSSTTTTTTTL